MNTFDRTLNTDSLSVGDQLVLVTKRGGRWGSKVDRREKILTVKKVLKTRLVCEDEGGRVYRFIVEFSPTYSYRNGQVSADLEGDRARENTWRIWSEVAYLFTPDDSRLLSSREEDLARNEEIEIKRAAEKALEEFKRALTVENADKAIAALQAWKAAQE